MWILFFLVSVSNLTISVNRGVAVSRYVAAHTEPFRTRQNAYYACKKRREEFVINVGLLTASSPNCFLSAVIVPLSRIHTHFLWQLSGQCRPPAPGRYQPPGS